MTKKINFTVSPQYIIDLMERQSEGIDKALAELVMNSVDAKAKAVHIRMEKNFDTGLVEFSVEDDGRGFTKKTIMEYFRLFGEPHVAGDATYGAFRLGRAQIFSVARTEWHTRSYIMRVDIRKALDEKQIKDLGFELLDSDRIVKGCCIQGTIYDRYAYVEDIQSNLTRIIKYMPVPVYFNGQRITIPIKDLKKEKTRYFQDEVAHYFLDPTAETLELYNQGVVVDFPEFTSPLARGIVISKMPFALDHSRRIALKERCPVWQQMDSQLSKFANAQCLNFHEGDVKNHQHYLRLAMQHLDQHGIKYCEALNHFVTARILRDHLNNEVSLLDLFAVQRIGVAHELGPRIERVADIERMPLLHDGPKSMMHHIDLRGTGRNYFERFVNFANQCCQVWMAEHSDHPSCAEYRDFVMVEFDINDEKYQATYQEIDEDTMDYMAHHKLHCYLTALNDVLHPIIRHHLGKCSKREMKLGRSNEAEAWTDGSTRITFDAKTNSTFYNDGNYTKLILLMAHEYCHDGDSRQGHGSVFYKAFHDLVQSLDYPVIIEAAEQQFADNLLTICA